MPRSSGGAETLVCASRLPSEWLTPASGVRKGPEEIHRSGVMSRGVGDGGRRGKRRGQWGQKET